MRHVRSVPARLALAGLALCAAVAVAPAAPAPRPALLTVPADVPAEKLGGPLHASVTVRALVSPAGLVDSARAVAGEARLRAPAEAAVRWWVFPPAKGRAWLEVAVPFSATGDEAPLHPDVLALARESETRGDLATALAAWVGALNRVGLSPVVNNEWGIREHAIAIARRMPEPPRAGDAITARARGARGAQLRTVARADHMGLVESFDAALAAAPWWAEPYLWRAGSQAGCGRTAEALRSLRAYRIASSDTAGIAFASRLIDRLAAADTVGVSEAVKTWGVASEPRTR